MTPLGAAVRSPLASTVSATLPVVDVRALTSTDTAADVRVGVVSGSASANATLPVPSDSLARALTLAEMLNVLLAVACAYADVPKKRTAAAVTAALQTALVAFVMCLPLQFIPSALRKWARSNVLLPAGVPPAVGSPRTYETVARCRSTHPSRSLRRNRHRRPMRTAGSSPARINR